MSDLISRSALMKEFEIQEFIKNDRVFDIPQIKAFINEQPTVEPVRGEWKVKTKYQGGYIVSITCSNCGYPHSRVLYNFCPECGADMRKGGDHNV